MKVVSLCAGVGITDMCFTLNGAQILVASDLDTASLEVYKYNHDYQNENFNASLVQGDLALPVVQKAIIDAAKAKLAPDESLDVLTIFLPPCKNLADLLLAVKHIANELKAKIIYVDALKRASYGKVDVAASLASENYLNFSVKHQLKNYGVPSQIIRQPFFLFDKKYFSEFAARIEATLTDLPHIEPKTLDQLFTSIVGIENFLQIRDDNGCGLIRCSAEKPSLSQLSHLPRAQYILTKNKLFYFNKDQNKLDLISESAEQLAIVKEILIEEGQEIEKIINLSIEQREKITFATDHAHIIIPLQGPTIKNVSKYSALLREKLSNLKPGEQLYDGKKGEAFAKRISGSTKAIRAQGNSIFGHTPSGRASLGWEWVIHPTKNRGFTPLEMCFIATLDLIPFELAPKNAITLASSKGVVNQRDIMNRIAGCTPPAYLFNVIQQVLFPAFGLISSVKPEIPDFKEPDKYSFEVLDNQKYYLGSRFPFKMSISKAANIFEPKDGKDNRRKTKFKNYRDYLLNSLHDYGDTLTASEENLLFKKLIENFSKIEGTRPAVINKRSKALMISSEFLFTIKLMKLLFFGSKVQNSYSELIREFEEAIRLKELKQNGVRKITITQLQQKNHDKIEKLLHKLELLVSDKSFSYHLQSYDEWKTSNQNVIQPLTGKRIKRPDNNNEITQPLKRINNFPPNFKPITVDISSNINNDDQSSIENKDIESCYLDVNENGFALHNNFGLNLNFFKPNTKDVKQELEHDDNQWMLDEVDNEVVLAQKPGLNTDFLSSALIEQDTDLDESSIIITEDKEIINGMGFFTNKIENSNSNLNVSDSLMMNRTNNIFPD